MTSPSQRHKADEHFLIRTNAESLLGYMERVGTAHPTLQPFGWIFHKNIVAVYALAMFPFTYARAVSAQQRLLVTAAMATAKLPQMGLQDFLEKFTNTAEKLAEETRTTQWNQEVNESARYSLSRFVENEIACQSADHILRQSTVLCWSAFEVLATDLFVFLLNADCDLAGLLFKDERTKKLFQTKDLGKVLEDYDYNLSNRMGDALLQQCRLDDVSTIRAIYDVLLPNGCTHAIAMLHDERLWRLNKDRNLVVHRASIIDEAYRKATGAKTQAGTELRISPGDFEDMLTYICELGLELLSALGARVGKA